MRADWTASGAYQWLDRAPKGRNETETGLWWRRHDEHDSARGSEPQVKAKEGLMTSLRGKSAVVIGGSSGVGEATVKALISEGDA